MKKKPFSVGVTIALMALTAALTLTLTYQYAMNRFNQQVKNVTERQKMYAKLYQIDTKTRGQFLFDIDETRLNDAIAEGYVAGLGDAYSRYLAPSDCARLQQQLSGKQVGIGAEFAVNELGEARISRLIEGAPAAVGGVQVNDRIVAVNGQDVTDWDEADIAAAIDGDAGTEVVLTLARQTESGEVAEQNVTLTRRSYDLVTVESRMLGDNIGHIRIYTFNERTDSEFASAMTSLTNAGMAGLVIDVRNNGGGTLKSAANILDSLLPAGNIVYSGDASGKKTVMYTSDAAQNTVPLVVLINGHSASAAELVAAAVQDYERGTVIGAQSVGKGTLQELYTFTDGSGLSLTTAYFYPPLGNGFDQTGVTPDVRVALDYTGSLDLLPDDADTQLNAAVSKLRQDLGLEAPSDADDGEVSGDGTDEVPADGESDGTESGAADDASSAIAMADGCADATRI